ncbi:alpha/beta fold hydrolase [Phenylobacterium sp.]|uniref:alpha/beta fold hydrolase n=1 Tax=Phenylobacterium sp. TaxID=1871053 RepID=UPI002736FD1B|nr:alpha/beta hydrolase [Phenylobacterium sp.]MDP3635313.1 alpha/beta hydrolase [Phenylobacterium sp.]
MPTAHVNGLDLYYERAGSGPPLLFISGTGGDLRNKPNQFDGPFPKAFDMVSYDQRGLGRSDKPDVAYSMADYADDASALMGELGIGRAHIVGVSFGGMVAQELVLRHPRRVDRLVLACTSPGGAGGASFPFHEIDHLKGEARARHLTPISDTRRDAAWAEANPDTYRQIIAISSADPYGEEPDHEMGARRQLEARAHHDTWDRLDQIEAPTLIAAGRYDGIALPATQENLASRIRGSVLRFFEGGHLFMIQDRTATATMIRFLNGEEV